MTASSLDLSARADLDWLADLIGDAQQAVPSIEWMIVGALARDLHLSYAYGIRIDRVTTDTDFDYPLASARLAGRDASALLHRHGDPSQTVRRQLHSILATEVDPEGARVLIGQSGALDAERFRNQLIAFQRGLAEG